MENRAINRIGTHASIKSLKELSKYYKLFQIFISPSQGMSFDYKSAREQLSYVTAHHPDCEFIVHGPYWHSLFHWNNFFKSTVRNILDHARIMTEYGVKTLVIHPGARRTTDKILTQEETMDFFTESLIGISDELPPGFTLCIENIPVGKENSRGLYCRNIIEVLKKVKRNNIQFCFDVEHHFACGEDLNDHDYLMSCAYVCHFNAIPKTVKYGSHLDRHSNTALNEGHVLGPEFYWSMCKKYPKVYKVMEVSTEVALRNVPILVEGGVLNLS